MVRTESEVSLDSGETLLFINKEAKRTGRPRVEIYVNVIGGSLAYQFLGFLKFDDYIDAIKLGYMRLSHIYYLKRENIVTEKEYEELIEAFKTTAPSAVDLWLKRRSEFGRGISGGYKFETIFGRGLKYGVVSGEPWYPLILEIMNGYIPYKDVLFLIKAGVFTPRYFEGTKFEKDNPLHKRYRRMYVIDNLGHKWTNYNIHKTYDIDYDIKRLRFLDYYDIVTGKRFKDHYDDPKLDEFVEFVKSKTIYR